MKKNLLATAVLAAAMSMEFEQKVSIKKAVQATRNWKEDQSKDNKKPLYEKPIQKE